MNKKSSTKDLGLSSNERLSIINKSIFKPKKIPNLKPYGLKIYTFHAGFKKKFNDLLLVIFSEPVQSSVVYSKTTMPSAPIIWDKLYNKGTVKALIVNSGNANAHTGKKGINIINKYVNELVKIANCKKSEILVSSTGIIGEIFNPRLIIDKFIKIKKTASGSLLDAAKAIMTTDTYPKTSVKNVIINNKRFKIYGIAKGSGMIQPNMGTMLSYIFIETELDKLLLNKLLKNNIQNTFNCISTDSDTSTSDTLALFSLKKTKINFKSKKNFNKLEKSLREVMKDLSLKVVKDGEGLSKLIIVNVFNSKSKQQARIIAFAVANSPLVKTAIAGEDSNWGRIIAAIGKSGEKINQNKIKIFFGKNLVCNNGSIYEKINNNKLNKYMKNNIIEIKIQINNGNNEFIVYGNDLTHEYVRINAEYRS